VLPAIIAPMRGEPQDGIDLRRYVRQAWRRKWLLLAVVVLIPAATYLLTQRQEKVYEASTLLRVTPQNIDVSDQISFESSGATETATIIQTTAVARLAARELGEDPAAAGGLLGKIDANIEGEGTEAGFLRITATDSDPDSAASIANAFAGAITQSRTNDAITKIDETIATLSEQGGDATTQSQIAQQIQQLQTTRATLSDTTQVIEPAGPPGSPVSPNPGRNARIAFVLALLIAAGLVPVLDALDRRLREPEELEELSDAPLLGSVPEGAFPGKESGPFVHEAFQTLRAGLTYFNIDRTIDAVLIASPTRGDGKTTVAANLARALAEDGRKVIAVDCDLRRPQLAKRLGVADQVNFGLDSVLIDRREVNDALVDVEVEGGQLRVLPGGSPPNPSVLLGSESMRTLIAKLRESGDMVILDTPPLLAVSDAIPLQEQVSGTVLVARMDHTGRDGVRKASAFISTAGGNLLGFVATGVQLGGVGGHAYAYGYGYTAEGAENGAGPDGGRWRFPLGRRERTGSDKPT
jgi:capsular exopolysaccharide synthesis family protein